MSILVTSHYPFSELLVYGYCRLTNILPSDDVINLMILFCKILPIKIGLFVFEFSELFEDESYNNTHIFSNQFGDNNWCVSVEKGDKNTIAVHLLRLPARIKSVECSFKFELLSNESIWNIHKITKTMNLLSEQDAICKWKAHYQDYYQDIVMVSIEILNVIDDDGNDVEENKWREFNVDRCISYNKVDEDKYVWKDWDNSWDFFLMDTTKVSWL